MKASDPVWDSGASSLKAQISLQLLKDHSRYSGVTPIIAVESVSGLGLLDKSLKTLGMSIHNMASLTNPVCTPFSGDGKATCEVSSSDEGEVHFSLQEPKFDIVLSISMIFYPPPVLSVISPLQVGHSLEQTLTLAGEKFREGAKVFVDAEECTNVQFLTSTTLTCRLPLLSVGTKTVAVQNQDQQFGGSVSLLVYDATPPLLEWIGPAEGTAAQAQVDVEVSCEVGLPVKFSGAGLLAPITANCDTGTLQRSLFFSAGEGVKTIKITQDRGYGVTTTRTRNFIRDNTSPNILVTSPATTPYYHSGGSLVLSGSCEIGLPLEVKVNGGAGPVVSCSGTGTWTTSVNPAGEGTFIYLLSQTDAAGNKGEAQFTLVNDSTPPALNFVGGVTAFSVTTAGNFYTFSGGCETSLSVKVTGQDSATTPCVNGSWSYKTAAQTSDGIYSYQFQQKDLAGNQSTISGEWTRNTQGPVLTLDGSPAVRTAETAHTFAGSCEAGTSISVSGAETTSLTCNSGTWSFTSASLAEGAHNYVFTQANALSVSTSVSAQWIRDISAPTPELFEVVGGGPIGMPYANLRFKATDAAGIVTGFCVKVGSATAPAQDASCWEATSSFTTPASTVTVSSYSQLISFTAGTYNVYLWWRDDLGNISVATVLPVTYAPIPPPTVMTVLASNSTTLEDHRSERQIAAGQTVNIKWKVGGSQLLNKPVSLYFTVDDKEWNLIKDNLFNGVNGSCVLDGPGSKDDDVTGCYTWANASPVSSYYRLRVSVKNEVGAVVFANSAPINALSLDLLAGNTESGVNGSASAAVFLSNPASRATVPRIRSLVVTQKGLVYINDYEKGLLTVDPATGFLKTVLPKDPNCVVENELKTVTSSCLKKGAEVVLDQNEDLLILDGDRIRKIYLSQTPMRIETIIGGGTDSSITQTDPLKYKSTRGLSDNTASAFFKVLPNNDILFKMDGVVDSSLDTSGPARIYYAATKTIARANFSGMGASFSGTQNIQRCGLADIGFTYVPGTTVVDEMIPLLYSTSACVPSLVGPEVSVTRVNPLTYAVDTSQKGIPAVPTTSFNVRFYVGRNGKLYSVNRNFVKEYSSAGNGSFVTILGTGTAGHCAAGADATACAVDVDDIYVTRTGTVFFLSRNAIRMIDNAGKVRDVFGQAIGTAEGLLAKDVRFGLVSTFDRSPSGKMAVYESGAYRIREFVEGGTLSTVIGNGSQGTTGVGSTKPSITQPLPLASTTYDIANMFYVGDDNIVFNGTLQRLLLWDRSLAYANRLSGDGTVDYRLAETSGVPSDSLAVNLTFQPAGFETTSRVLPIGAGSGKILIAARGMKVGGSVEYDSNLIVLESSGALSNANSYQMSTLLKAENTDTPAVANLCADGVDLLKCVTANSQATIARYVSSSYSELDGGWMTLHRAQPKRLLLLPPGGVMRTLTTLQQNAGGIARARHNGRDYVFYCSDTSSRLRRVDITDATPVETELPWDIPSWECYGRSLIYNEGPQGPRLLFQLQQNGLFGIAEYLDPFR